MPKQKINRSIISDGLSLGSEYVEIREYHKDIIFMGKIIAKKISCEKVSDGGATGIYYDRYEIKANINDAHKFDYTQATEEPGVIIGSFEDIKDFIRYYNGEDITEISIEATYNKGSFTGEITVKYRSDDKVIIAIPRNTDFGGHNKGNEYESVARKLLIENGIIPKDTQPRAYCKEKHILYNPYKRIVTNNFDMINGGK